MRRNIYGVRRIVSTENSREAPRTPGSPISERGQEINRYPSQLFRCLKSLSSQAAWSEFSRSIRTLHFSRSISNRLIEPTRSVTHLDLAGYSREFFIQR